MIDEDEIGVIPHPQKEGDPFEIHFSEFYGTKMGQFRYILNSNEISERAFDLVTFINKKVPPNQVAWYYREKLLLELKKDLIEEEAFLENELTTRFPKYFQYWTHKKWLTRQLNGEYDETDFFKNVIKVDEKNFHAWSFFVWYAREYNKGRWLYNMTTPLIQHDPKNNSAWSARFQALKLGQISVQEDIDFTLGYFQLISDSESTANYIRGLLGLDMSIENDVRDAINFVLKLNSNNKVALSLLMYVEKLKGNVERYDELADKMASIDTVRSHFWKLMKSDSKRFD
ncbi:prenyltransferase alpha subunit [Histomonas meleagridis]|uniref:prenyltransferase alpha subunit n=1 Tax=Histomonas meleagridis TaxID=135588 RepID=UPI00355A6F42|nr:prenyltransferase alpha subunit [Histomonas meleagridis]KAH0805942.1 prenyltransferase alpha subunit [Histomonas meleagridis]